MMSGRKLEKARIGKNAGIPALTSFKATGFRWTSGIGRVVAEKEAKGVVLSIERAMEGVGQDPLR